MTNVYLIYSEIDGYTIDANGWIPGCVDDLPNGKVLVVIPRAVDFNMREKKLIWLVEEFTLNPITDKWVSIVTGKFNRTTGQSTITVSNLDFVDSTTGLTCLESDPNAVGEFDYYVANLGKPVVYPVLQATIQHRFV